MESLAIEDKAVLSIRDDLKVLTERFLTSLDVKSNSRSTYRRALRVFRSWWESERISNPSRETVLAYKGSLERAGLSALTISGYLVTVRKFFEWLESVKLYPNVAKGIKGTRRKRGFRKEPLTIEQVKGLVNSIDRTTLGGKRDYALLTLLVGTGLRTIEVVRANAGDIRQESGEAILWVHGKGRDSKDEFVLLTAGTLDPIREYLFARGKVKDDDPLFASLSNHNRNQRLTTISVSRIVKTKLRGIGLNSDRLTAHSLRHTAITLALLGGATIQEAQALGRHADINTTMIYAHNIDRITHAPERKIEALLSRLLQ